MSRCSVSIAGEKEAGLNGVDETLRFLEIVWGEEECYVDLPSKTMGHWMPHNFLWPDTDLARSRVETALQNREDLYFSVARFRSRGRRYEDTLPLDWLWADLDEVDPEVLEDQDLLPTVAWQSSEGRYQALWSLTKQVKATEVEKINQRLSYAIGADRGGWDLTQVLRVPGTRNYKYGEEGHRVELLWAHADVQYNPREMWERLKNVDVVGVVGAVPKRGLKAVAPRREIGGRVKALLRVEEDAVVAGERSDRLWELECLLAEAGRSEVEIFRLVVGSAWNKFKEDRHRGEDRLRKDIRRAMAHVARKLPPPDRVPGEEVEERSAEVDPGGEGEGAGEEEGGRRGSQFVDYANFLSANLEAPEWLIRDIWTSGAHGLIAGEPKTQKSTLSIAMALSVASGKPFLGEYPVDVTGPVLIVQEENDPWVVQDRMRKIAAFYGLLGEDAVEEVGTGALGGEVLRIDFPHELPIRLMNNYGWDMVQEDNRELLEKEIKEVQPALVILDPLYLMIGAADTDKSRDVVPFLRWLLRLRYRYRCAIAIIHHYRKANASFGNGVRPGQRVMGSGTFHGWVESAMYCEPMDLEEHEVEGGIVRLKVEREFRNVGPRLPIEVQLAIGEPGDLDFDAAIDPYTKAGFLHKLIRMTPGISAKEVGKLMGSDTKTVVRLAREDNEVAVKQVGRGVQLFLNGDGNGYGDGGEEDE